MFILLSSGIAMANDCRLVSKICAEPGGTRNIEGFSVTGNAGNMYCNTIVLAKSTKIIARGFQALLDAIRLIVNALRSYPMLNALNTKIHINVETYFRKQRILHFWIVNILLHEMNLITNNVGLMN